MTEHSNPPAFPTKLSSDFRGMSLLDHFAGLAMQGLMGRVWCDPITGKPPDNLQEVWAEGSYQMANAMLKERQKWIK